MKKFELDYTSQTKYKERTLYRIKALKDFVTTDGTLIQKDDLGGYVQSEANLDQKGNSWIFKGAMAIDDSRVLGDATLHNDAIINDHAIIENQASAHNNIELTGYARVSEQATITRNAHIAGYARIREEAFVTGDATVREFATITGNAKIFGQAKVSGHAVVAHRATILEHADISENARIMDTTQVGGHAKVYGFAHIENQAKISGHAIICDHATVKNKTYVTDNVVICDHTILNVPEMPLQCINNNAPDYTIRATNDFATFKGFDNAYITFVTATQTWLQNDKDRHILFEGDTDKFIAHGYAHSKAWGDCYKSYATIVKDLEPKKFELDKSSKISVDGITLYRIRALKNFGVVKKGDLGGYVEKEENLSQKGNAWIFDNAKAMDDAIVKDDATLHHNATVCDDAIISGSASINENVTIYDQATVSDNAILYGNVTLISNAKIYGKARLYDHVVVSGNAQVYDNARCLQSAKIKDNAQVFNDATINNAFISGAACVFDKATVEDNSVISGHIKLYGDITVFGQAYMTSDDDVTLRSNDDYMVLKHWSNKDMITYIKPSDHWHSPAFSSSTEGLRTYAENKPNKNKILAYIDFVTDSIN